MKNVEKKKKSQRHTFQSLTTRGMGTEQGRENSLWTPFLPSFPFSLSCWQMSFKIAEIVLIVKGRAMGGWRDRRLNGWRNGGANGFVVCGTQWYDGEWDWMILLVKGVAGGLWTWVTHGCGGGSGTNRHGGSVLMGENGYQAWAIMSPNGSVEIEGTYWHAMLTLIHLDHGCTVCVCLGAWSSRGYWQSRRTPRVLQRAQVISMLSLPFETWFSYSLSAKVTRLGETAGRLAAMESHFKSLLLLNFSLSLSVSLLSLVLSSFRGREGESRARAGGWEGVLEGSGGNGNVYVCSLE